MRITDRIKKLKKLIGSEIKYSYSDEFFTPKTSTSKIIGLQIDGLYDINLIVKCEGIVNPLNTIKRYEVFKIIKLPLIKMYMGKYLFPVYNCIDQNVKTIFITKNDIDSSLLKNFDNDIIDTIEDIKQKLKINISVKKNFICDNENKTMQKMFKINEQELSELKRLGLSLYGWRNTLDETYIFDVCYFNLDIVYDINCNIEQLEELEIYSGLLKLSKTKLKL